MFSPPSRSRGSASWSCAKFGYQGSLTLGLRSCSGRVPRFRVRGGILYWEGVKLELANGFSVGGGQLNVEKRFWRAGVLVGLAGARARSSRPRKEAGPQLAERPPSHVGV